MPKQEQHNQKVWEDFWDPETIDEVYSNSARIIGQVQSLTELDGKRVIEIGAGSGRDGFKLVDLGATVILLDYADNSLKVMKHLAHKMEKPVFLVKGDAFHLPFKDDCMDVVYHQGLLEHFSNPEEIIKENYRITARGGYTLADVPQTFHLYTLIKHLLIWMNKWFAGWETEFTIGQLAAMFRQQGFHIYHRYGSWMRPGLFYRALRKALLKLRINIAPYPKIPLISAAAEAFAKWFKTFSLSFYTFMDIGVIGIKDEREQ
ncbi:MAG: class I SAM-dependent methyltransferase [candidate division KSB1 bacterium]|nr:class I SAM-dependent methyltransferase [candidate division KSB1 bacterium]